MLKTYLKNLVETAEKGDATEESYYSSLAEFIEQYAKASGKTAISVTTLPKRTEAGNPDFRIWDGNQKIIGYIEAKSPEVENLDGIENTEQLKRYLATFPNLILTNFLEFRFYRNGSLADKVLIGKPFILYQLRKIPPIENESGLVNLLEKFFSFSLPKIQGAEELATELAKRTRFLKEIVIDELNMADLPDRIGDIYQSVDNSLSGFYKAFQKYLIGNLTKKDFADLYSQTITYGLFVARTRAENNFNRKLAYDNIPHTIGLLRDLFKFISSVDLPRQMEWIVDDISAVLAETDVKNILRRYFHEGKGKDPIVHFYETFLNKYDPETREKRGVYYTPEPVVSYIVRSLNIILKDCFGIKDGFASEKVTVLDPAAGTLTFLAETAKLAVEEFVSKYGKGEKEHFIREHILKNFYGFELMMAPYAVGHLKISFLLEELGYKMQGDDRFKLYLTNTLEMEDFPETMFPGIHSLSEESRLAGTVKKEMPILAIIGNPPYSGHSTNIGEWISKEIKTYYQVDGKPLGEKNPKWLQDDYVKFIRFAQWKIDQAGEGIIGFITNHSYLDSPTFRGMRQSLMDSFHEIYVLDLHGSSLKKERTPEGSKDENVFDIQQGVAIVLLVKKDVKKTKTKVYHSEVWGLRKEKYNYLLKNDNKTTKWQELAPKSEFYFFIPRDKKFEGKYEKFLKISEVFSLSSVGIVTARDDLTIKWSPEEVWRTVSNFSRLDSELARITYKLGKDAQDWKVELAQKDLKDSGLDKSLIKPILYRPFDTRYTYYTGKSRGFICRPRQEVMRHMLQENLGLHTCRQTSSLPWQHALITDGITDDCFVSNKTRERGYLFPLYLYPEDTGGALPIHKKEPNIKPAIFKTLSEAYREKPLPEKIFYYIYGLLYSNTYRKKYAEFLKSDFPRIPFTKDYPKFKKMAELGKQLADLHLLKSAELDPLIARFPISGDNKVKKVKYSEKELRVYFNPEQYFEGVTKKVWEYKIGGYQVCEKWLKDRKNRPLSLEEIKLYCTIVTALAKTMEIQEDIDALYPEMEREIAF